MIHATYILKLNSEALIFSKFLQNENKKYSKKKHKKHGIFLEFFSFSQSQVYSPVTSSCKSIIF